MYAWCQNWLNFETKNYTDLSFVQRILDAVVDYLPSPVDLPPVKGINPKTDGEVFRSPSDEEPFCALAFKLQTDPFVGQLTFFRVFSGVVKSGSYIYNATNGQKERLGRIVRLMADKRTEIEEVYPFTFDALEALPGGTYQVKYTDSLSSRSVTIEKVLLPGQQWIRVSPGTVFSNTISVTFTAPETGNIAFRLLSISGNKLAEKQLTVSQGQTQQISFPPTSFAKGVYFLQYISKTQQRVVKLLKL